MGRTHSQYYPSGVTVGQFSCGGGPLGKERASGPWGRATATGHVLPGICTPAWLPQFFTFHECMQRRLLADKVIKEAMKQ